MNRELKLISFFFIIITSYQCIQNDKSNLVNIRWLKRGEFTNIEEFKLIIDKKQDGSISYLYRNIQNKQEFNFEIIINEKEVNYFSNFDTIKLTQLALSKINISDKEYEVYNLLRYRPNENDRAINFFIVKEFGVINILKSSNMRTGLIQFLNKPNQEIMARLNIELMLDTNFYLYNNNPPPLP